MKSKGNQCDSRAKSGGGLAPHTEPQVHGPDGGRNKDPRLLSVRTAQPALCWLCRDAERAEHPDSVSVPQACVLEG